MLIVLLLNGRFTPLLCIKEGKLFPLLEMMMFGFSSMTNWSPILVTLRKASLSICVHFHSLGGIHGALTASVNLDSLGLTTGQSYTLDFFHAERYALVPLDLYHLLSSFSQKNTWLRLSNANIRPDY
jgi:hypothetical protein